MRDVGRRQRREQPRSRRQRACRLGGVRRQEPDHERFQARGRGRASSITKPFSQITVIVRQKAEEEGEPKAKKKSKAAAGKPAKEAKGGGAKKQATSAKKVSKAKPAAKETE